MRKNNTFWKRLASGLVDGLLFLPYVFLTTTHTYYYFGIELSYILLWTAYSVYCHGKYGQTLGKRLTGIQVLDITEVALVGHKRAFFREAAWFVVSLVLLAYAFWQSGKGTYLAEEVITLYDFLVAVVSVGWLATELITMLLNEKRRAVHDFMARSVVVDLNYVVDQAKAQP